MMKGHYAVHPHIGEQTDWPPVIPIPAGMANVNMYETPTMNLRLFKKKDGTKVLQQAWQKGLNLIWKDVPDAEEEF